MGKLRGFFIEFSNDRDVYDAGDTISGNVVIDLTEDKMLRGISMHILGKADVHWTEEENRGKQKIVLYYSSFETYVDERKVVWGEDVRSDPTSADVMLRLPTGVHRFPFSFTLPAKPLPCSFEGELGNIRYYCKAVMERPWKFSHTTKKIFTVTGVPYDLNKEHHALTPIRAEDQKTVCCLCCATGPISLSVNTDRKAYVPGENVSISALLENKSHRRIHDTQAELIQSVTYIAYRGGHYGVRHCRTLSHVVTSIKSAGCDGHGTIEWNNKKLKIPPIPPTGLHGCYFINANYCIKFTADVVATPFDMDLMLNIVIGTVPLHCLYQKSHAAEAFPRKDSLPVPLYKHVFSGSSEIHEKDEDEYMFGDKYYSPVYTYYNWPIDK
ncbi:arrestin domain-containing protein 3-like [Saccoglossus kowalevskii]|uniref:Arrestin domain-containing protein 3-like n=1 Tax=Saccoglossus kowalevskii TaxID=10224 RepID=A0ABM0GKZ3_SACKO|nr:PREDICTED: arrestin domain-containing protein 3-like [Saccoglossus kowalevskii]